jgi:hypothetical protein
MLSFENRNHPAHVSTSYLGNTMPSTSVSQKITLTINAWKAKLLDLSRRNRGLNFKPNKVSTVTVIDELPTEIFRLLCLEGRSMKFKASPLPVATSPPATEPAVQATMFQTPVDEDLEEDIPSPDFTPYDTATLANQHTDEYLQTNAVSSITGITPAPLSIPLPAGKRFR